MIRSDVVEARRGQTLIFSTQSQTRRIQALLSKFVSNFGLYRTFKLYRLFWRQKFCFISCGSYPCLSGLGGAVVQRACSNDHDICKDPGSSPTYDQWSFSSVEKVSPLPQSNPLWNRTNMENTLSVMILNYHNK